MLCQCFLHLLKAFPAACIIVPVHQYGTLPVKQAKQGHFGEALLCNGLIGTGNVGACYRYIQQCIVVAGNDIGFACLEVFLSLYGQGAEDQVQPNLHPDLGDAYKQLLALWLGQGIRNHGWKEYNEERNNETDDSPKGPDPGK